MNTYKKKSLNNISLKEKINKQPRMELKTPEDLHLMDRNVGRKHIPNYSLVNGFHYSPLSLYDKVQSVALTKNNLAPNYIIDENHIKDIITPETFDTIKYGKIQDHLENIDLSESSIPVNDINGGSIFSSILDTVKSFLPSLSSIGKTILGKPSIIKDVVQVSKDVSNILSPKEPEKNKVEKKEEPKNFSIGEELINLYKEGKLSSEQLTTLLSNPSNKPSKKGEGISTSESESDIENKKSEKIKKLKKIKKTKNDIILDKLNFLENKLNHHET